MNNKKAIELPFATLIVVLILVVTAIAVIGFFTGTFSAGAGELKKGATLDQNPDYDNLISVFDKCPCRPGPDNYEGCPSEADIPKTSEAIKKESEIINDWCPRKESKKNG